VGRGVGRGSRGAHVSWLVQRCGTLATELVSCRITCSARRADPRQRRSALATEICSGGILRLAAGTLHTGAPHRRAGVDRSSAARVAVRVA
jgi:hypothetical protein